MVRKKKTLAKLIMPTTIKELVQLSINLEIFTLEWLAFKCIDPLVIEQMLTVSSNTLRNWDKKDILQASLIERRRYIDGFDVVIMLDKGNKGLSNCKPVF